MNESEMAQALELLLAERAIARVLCTYSRAADRFDLELMRSCYWPDGTDDHGSYNGGVDGFIEFVRPALRRFDRTNHFLGNMLIDVDLPDDVARAETYIRGLRGPDDIVWHILDATPAVTTDG